VAIHTPGDRCVHTLQYDLYDDIRAPCSYDHLHAFSGVSVLVKGIVIPKLSFKFLQTSGGTVENIVDHRVVESRV
jgi:hypothetical protein